MEENNRIHIMIRGRVQGVGFRAFVLTNARDLGVTGWVRNVGYDQVEAVAEGNSQILERLVGILHAGPPSSHVEELNYEELPGTNEFDRFNVRYF